VAERKFKPWVLSDAPNAPPASKERIFKTLVPEDATDVLVGVISNPPMITPAPVLVLVIANV